MSGYGEGEMSWSEYEADKASHIKKYPDGSCPQGAICSTCLNEKIRRLQEQLAEAMKALRGCDVDAQQDRGLLALGKRLIKLEAERDRLQEQLRLANIDAANESARANDAEEQLRVAREKWVEGSRKLEKLWRSGELAERMGVESHTEIDCADELAALRQLQTEATCKHGHPMWALVHVGPDNFTREQISKGMFNEFQAEHLLAGSDVCSICEAVRDKEQKWADSLQDLLNNELCSCRTKPCDRCQVSIELSRAELAALRERLEKEGAR